MEQYTVTVQVRRAITEDISCLERFMSDNSDEYKISHASWISYTSSCQYATFYALCEVSQKILGVCVVMIAHQDLDIIYILTDKQYRMKGIGRLILNHIIKDLSPRKIYIDVSDKNCGAIEFYKRFGFTFIGRRKKYYVDVDALCGVKYC